MTATGLSDLVGAVLTLLTLALLGLGGYLLALLALGRDAARDPLRLAVAALLAATGEAVLLGLLLGACGLLWLPAGLAALALVVLAAGALLARNETGVGAVLATLRTPLSVLSAALWRRVREYPAMSLIALHAVAAEGLRGLVRPPLAWDSLMYHLLLTASWLRDGRIAPVFGPHPTNLYGLMPANGSVWLWWWMAPSHSELYVNLAFLPHCVLLALAAGGVARELGASRNWPVAAFLSLLTPTVIRWAATQYVDIFLGAALAAGAFFALRWLRQAQAGDAVLAGAGLGVCAGSKVLGLPYALALGGAVLVAALVPGIRSDRPPRPAGSAANGGSGGQPLDPPPSRRREWHRVGQVGAALAVMVVLGGFFYARNAATGAGPFAARCEGRPGPQAEAAIPSLPRRNTVLDLLKPLLDNGQLLKTFVGISQWDTEELGIGPQVALLLPVLVLLPLALPRGRRRAGLVVWSQILAQLALWVTVPYADKGQIYANVRYLIGATALAFAGGVAMAEERIADRWLRGLALALAVQDLLTLHAKMPDEVRLMVAAADCAALLLLLFPALRRFSRRHFLLIAAAGLVAVLADVPNFARFRVNDRGRAFAAEWTAHHTEAYRFAGGWGWLERHGGRGTVAAVSSPLNYFAYPVMGTRLERRAVYANINRADVRSAARYRLCDPRVNFDPEAWIANLRKLGVRWVAVSRFTPLPFPVESAWARARPALFALRYADASIEIFELLPGLAGFRQPVAACTSNAHTLCLGAGGRFAATVAWATADGKSGLGTAIPLPGNPDSGLFSFFAPRNVEMLIKVVDACAQPSPGYWVFFAATTDLRLTVTVVDTRSGQSRVYINPLGQPAQPVQDTTAFQSCP
jgi:hypothetical protein